MFREIGLGAALAALLASASFGAVRHVYTFNDGTADDSVGTADGTFQTGAVAAAGQLILGGAGQYVDLPAAAIGINAYTAVTLEAWVNVPASTNNSFRMAAVFGRSGDVGAGENAAFGYDYLFLQPSRGGGNLTSRGAISDNNFDSETAVDGPTVVGTGQHHFVVTVDSTAGVDNTTLTMYVDGALIGSATGADDLADVSNAVAYLGRSVYSGDPSILGTINEFRIHDSILNPTQVAASFTTGPAGPAGPTLTINRDTGAMTLSNGSSPVQIFSYSITSPSGGLNPATWQTVAGHFDSAGTGSFDADDAWTVLNLTATQINEEEPLGGGGPDDGGALGSVPFSASNGWFKSFREDVAITTEALVNGTVITLIPDIKYVGNGGQPFKRSDLNFDNAINGNDWTSFRSKVLGTIDPAFSDAQSYALGDLDGDQDSDFFDFRLFQQDFDAANGVGAFAALVGAVPEPSGCLLMIAACAPLAIRRRRFTRLN